MAIYLGIDVGTSAVKSVLVDQRQRLIASASSPLTILQPRAGWSEQQPASWWGGVKITCGILRRMAHRSYSGVCAIGLSGQMHGTVLVDRGGRTLRSSILWNDGRAEAEARTLNEDIGNIAEIAGIIAMPGFTAPKLKWLRRNEPETLRRLACVLQAKDYVRLRLTGEMSTDMSDASGTLFLDGRQRKWSSVIVEQCGLATEQLPRLHEGSDVAGFLLPTVARSLGLQKGVMVAAGGGDAAAGAIGVGAVNEGQHFISIGTSGQYFIARRQFKPRSGRLIHSFAHCIPDRWFDMAALLNGASCFTWLAGVINMPVRNLLKFSGKREGEAASVLFLPYLAGERTPHNDAGLRGSLIGLSHATDRTALVRAAVEGVALSFADVANDVLGARQEISPAGIIGGASQSMLVMKTLANALGRDVVRYRGGRAGAAFGAARLARMAFSGERAHEVCLSPPIGERICPDPALVPLYASRLKAFREAHGALRDVRVNSLSG